MTQDVRYWARVGMYVTKQFAEEWIEKIETQGGSTGGKYLDDEIEEYVAPAANTPFTLREEIEEIFSKPFEKVEMPPETAAILKVAEMEGNRVSRIKELKADGYSLEEAKEMVTSEINQAVADIMGIDLEEFEERENQRIAEARSGADESEASINDGEE